MSVRHPYDFVPFARPVEKEEWGERGPAGHERYSDALYSGTLHCMLETKSLLCIKTHFRGLKDRGAEPYLPGSSIKGMIRTVAQMLGAGCASYFQDNADIVDPILDLSLRPCTRAGACMVCRLFGYSTEGEEFGWSGKVLVCDSEPIEDWDSGRWRSIPAGKAQWTSAESRKKPLHRPFYYPFDDRPQEPAGWKAYRHAKNQSGATEAFRTDACVDRGENFGFRVEYENLSPEEFAVLRFALTLEHKCAEHKIDIRLAHKLGYGKSIGMGSCRIAITKTEPLAARRYFGDPAEFPELARCLVIEEYFKKRGFRRLSRILNLANAPDLLRFPSYGWFLDNGSASIEDFEKTLADKPPPPPPVTVTELPRRVPVTITSVGQGFVKGVTVEAYGGRKYTCTRGAGALYGAAKGKICLVAVDARSVDHKALTFEGRASLP